MQLCLRRANGWRGAGCCWGTWMTSDDMKVSKGLEFPVVALPGVGHMPAEGEDEQEAARVFYVAATRARATRATQRLVIGGWEAVTGVAFLYCGVQSQATQSESPQVDVELNR